MFWLSLKGSVTFGMLGIFLLIAGFKLFDLILTKVDFQEKMQENAIACAIIVSSFIFSLAYIISSVVQ
ncbi:MAG: DUF350 domain-containing protein [Neisseriaceae bacterium]|nr:MAG: DUF350 domain-containing protein [Neisseriaceae bacterium]